MAFGRSPDEEERTRSRGRGGAKTKHLVNASLKAVQEFSALWTETVWEAGNN